MIYDNVSGIRDSLKQDLALEFCRKKKDIRIVTETHINHDQIHHQVHLRNNWLEPNLFSPGDSHTKGSLALLHPGLKGINEVDTDPKGGFVSFKVTPLPLMSMFMPLEGRAPRSSPLGGVYLKNCKIIWKIKMREMETK